MKLKRVMAAVLLLLCAMSALAESAVITQNTRVYQKASTSSASMKVSKGMKVELLATKGAWALVEKNGVRAYMNKDHVEAVQTNPIATRPNYDDLMENAKPATITEATRVYQKPSTSSASVKVKKGTRVNLLAISGGWALVENGGVYAYVKKQYVEANSAHGALIKEGEPAVITQATRVYQKMSTSSASMKVAKGTKVNLIGVDGSWAMVENGGVYAYMNKDHVALIADPDKTPVATPTPAPTATPEPEQPDYSYLLATAKDGVFVKDGKVYKFADTSSRCTAVEKGTKVKLLAAKDGWMLIEKSGVYGFTDVDNVSVVTAATPAPENYFESSKYTNEQKCYLFFVREMGLNTAAACGLLANIRKESNFNPTAGSSYYGLVQWGGNRKTNLKNYCAGNGYDYTTLEGQLNFLAYELEQGYKNTVLKTLKSVSNTPQGAYEAAYEFCYKFERPANKAAQSVSRGNLAKDTYFPKYS